MFSSWICYIYYICVYQVVLLHCFGVGFYFYFFKSWYQTSLFIWTTCKTQCLCFCIHTQTSNTIPVLARPHLFFNPWPYNCPFKYSIAWREVCMEAESRLHKHSFSTKDFRFNFRFSGNQTAQENTRILFIYYFFNVFIL